MGQRKLNRYVTLLVCTLPLGCAVGPNFHSPTPPSSNVYNDVPLPEKTVGPRVQYFLLGKTIPEKWWELFHSTALNALIEAGFKANPTIESAQAALRQAQENLRAQIGITYFPTIDAQTFAERQRFNGSAFGANSSPSNVFNVFNAQINVAYNLDIFGGNKRQIEALKAYTDYQYFELEATYLTLATNITTTAITEAQLREQLKATQELINLNEKLLSILKQQFQLGGVASSAVLAQETQLAQTKALLPPLQKNLAQTRHALAALIGCYPSENNLPIFCLEDITLPQELPIHLPSVFVRQRPDIQAAEALLHQASAQIGVATANLFPQFTLTGNYGWEAENLADLFTKTSNIWAMTGQMLAPLFHGGALLAQRRAAIAAFDQAKAQYKKTLLQAFQNVADALRAIEFDAQALQAQLKAESTAKSSFILTEKQYRLGGTNYISLINAEQQYQLAVMNRIQVQALRLTDTAALFQALGGNWCNVEEDFIS